MTATSEALAEQATLLDKFYEIILGLIKNPYNAAEKAKAEAKIAELVAADEANAEALKFGNTKLKELLDAAAAAILPEIPGLTALPSDGELIGEPIVDATA